MYVRLFQPRLAVFYWRPGLREWRLIPKSCRVVNLVRDLFIGFSSISHPSSLASMSTTPVNLHLCRCHSHRHGRLPRYWRRRRRPARAVRSFESETLESTSVMSIWVESGGYWMVMSFMNGSKSLGSGLGHPAGPSSPDVSQNQSSPSPTR